MLADKRPCICRRRCRNLVAKLTALDHFAGFTIYICVYFDDRDKERERERERLKFTTKIGEM